jgi:phospholipid N-methyltransferase
MQWAHYAAFLREFLRQPMQLGTFVPSSRFLERRVVRLAEVHRARVVVELGAGVGGITSRTLENLPDRGRLVAVELSAPLARVLRTWSDPRLIVHEGSAIDFRTALGQSQLASPDVIICGIPLSVMPRQHATSLMNDAWESLAPGGRLVVYQFRRDVERIATFSAHAPAVEVEPLNIPPLRVYCWYKPLEMRTRLSARLLRSRNAGTLARGAHGNDPRRRPRQMTAEHAGTTPVARLAVRAVEVEDNTGDPSAAVRQVP